MENWAIDLGLRLMRSEKYEANLRPWQSGGGFETITVVCRTDTDALAAASENLGEDTTLALVRSARDALQQYLNLGS
jgi:hypothetical protein